MQSFPTLPDLLRNSTQPILSALPNPPPICVVHLLHRLFQHPVPPVLGHLGQSNGHFSRPGLGFWLLGLVEVCEDVALLAQEGGLCCAVLCVQGDGQIQDGGGEGEASELV